MAISTSGTSEPGHLPLDQTRAAHMGDILHQMQQYKWTLPSFFKDEIMLPRPGEQPASPIRVQMVSQFLQGATSVTAQDLAEAMFVCKYSTPPIPRNTADHPASHATPHGPPAERRVHHCLLEWVQSCTVESGVARSVTRVQ